MALTDHPAAALIARALEATGATAATVFVAVVALFVLPTIIQWYRLSHVPGPKLAAISKYWQVRESIKGTLPQVLKELNDKHGALQPSHHLTNHNLEALADHPHHHLQARLCVSGPMTSSPVTPMCCAR